jgi:CHC2-type zinc finger protein
LTEYDVKFDELNERVTIQQVAEQMAGVKLRPHKDELRGCCPISQSTNPRHFCITPSLNRYVCFCDTCKTFTKRGGDAIELIRRVRHFDKPLLAAREIVQHFGLDGTTPPEAKTETGHTSKKGFDHVAYQKRLQPSHDALNDCGVDFETIKAWGGGYANGNGALGGRLVLPLCELDGTINGFVGVALKGEDPELKYPNGVTVPFFFGLHMVQENRDLHIVYNPLDALRYAEDGYNVIAALIPLTREVLASLITIMNTKNITDLEFH